MNKNIKISLILAAMMLAPSIGSGLAYADIVIDGVSYSNEWIQSHPADVAKYIDANPGAAAAILQANPGAAAAVANAYNAAKGTNYTADTGMATLNQEAAKSSTPANIVVVGNQAYSNDWIKNNQAAVVDYITKNPNTSATILQNASSDTKKAVLDAYNKATGSNMTLSDGNQWISQNATTGLTKEWLAKHGGISKDPIWNDYTGLANDAQVAMWLKENPNLTPAQIVDAMQKYGIGLNQLTRAMRINNPSSTTGAQDLIKMANNAGITNEQLAQKGVISNMGLSTTMQNVWWAVQAGSMNKGVYCALHVVNEGTVDPYCPQYSQADMNTALSYQKNGYWGPSGSGDPYTELSKAGMLKNGAYTGPNTWGAGGGTGSTGPNIAGTNYAGMLTGTGGLVTTPSDTYSANPYASSFSSANLSALDTWITTKIRAKENTLSAADYSKLIDALVAKITTLKGTMTDQTKVTVLNYILYEVTAIQSRLSASNTSFLDDILK